MYLAKLAEPFPDLFVGIDVGENYLDLAWVEAAMLRLSFARISLIDIKDSVCDTLAERMAAAVPGMGAATVAIVDSPRWPRDLDSSFPELRLVDPAPAARSLDLVLREIYRVLRPAADGRSPVRGLSMFPTPRFEYFARCASDENCRAHLRAIARELFASLLTRGGAKGAGGGTFTRFMLAGFATYRALEKLGVAAYESYPDLQFRLSAPSAKLPPKKHRREALIVRNKIVAKLRSKVEIRDTREAATLDEADAAGLALAVAASARRGSLWTVAHRWGGQFLLALDEDQSNVLGRRSFELAAIE